MLSNLVNLGSFLHKLAGLVAALGNEEQYLSKGNIEIGRAHSNYYHLRRQCISCLDIIFRPKSVALHPCLLIFFALLSVSPAMSSDVSQSEVKKTLDICCFNGKDFEKDGGILIFQQPILFKLYNFAGLEDFDIKPLGQFFSALLEKSGITIEDSQLSRQEQKQTTGLIVLALPSDKSELSDDNFAKSVEVVSEVRNLGVGGRSSSEAMLRTVMTDLYALPGSKSDYMRFKSSDRLDAVIAFVRMLPGDVYAQGILEASVFQALGYNLANKEIESGSIFSQASPSRGLLDPTDLDYEVVRQLYKDRKILKIRNYQDIEQSQHKGGDKENGR